MRPECCGRLMVATLECVGESVGDYVCIKCGFTEKVRVDDFWKELEGLKLVKRV